MDGLHAQCERLSEREVAEKKRKKTDSLKVSEAFDIFQDEEDLSYDDHIKSNAVDAKRFKKGGFDSYRKLYNAMVGQDEEWLAWVRDDQAFLKMEMHDSKLDKFFKKSQKKFKKVKRAQEEAEQKDHE